MTSQNFFSIPKSIRFRLFTLLLIASFYLLTIPGQAIEVQPVRLAITAATGSGVEQELVDYISTQLGNDSGVVLNTVNPDWYVLCTIKDKQDEPTGQIRYNGTVTIKTLDGQIVNTTSVQKYNQDFSLQEHAPLNKQLVDSAARDVIGGLCGRAVDNLRNAVQIELHAREQIAEAEALADADKYDDAISMLEALGPDTVHFIANKKVIVQYKMEKRALELVHDAEAKAKIGRYNEAIELLKEVDLHSKRHQMALKLSRHYKYLLALAQRRANNQPKKKDPVNLKATTSVSH